MCPAFVVVGAVRTDAREEGRVERRVEARASTALT